MEKLSDLVEIFRVESHKIVKDRNTGGICYLLAHCLNEYLLKLGYKSRKVTGNQALLKKGKRTRYVTYGTFEPDNFNSIGHYHTWCEIDINDITYIIDTSLAYNKSFLRRQGISLSKNIPNSLFSNFKSTYYYKYLEDKSLNHLSEETLAEIPEEFIRNIIAKTLQRARQYSLSL